MDEERTEKIDNSDLLSQNYEGMDETGREKLKEVSEKILEIHQKNEKPCVITHGKI
jgi:hypothetical protein